MIGPALAPWGKEDGALKGEGVLKAFWGKGVPRKGVEYVVGVTEECAEHGVLE